MERLNTKGKQGISFYDFWDNRRKYKKDKRIKNLLKYYQDYPNIPEIKKWKYIFNLYFSAISLFRPITAMELYCKYRPHTILDFTMDGVAVSWQQQLSTFPNISASISTKNLRFLTKIW